MDLKGNQFANAITGNNGSNVIDGSFGNDTLTGLGGSDTFVFNTALDAGTNVDRIVDFSAGEDHIQLSISVFSAFASGIIGAGQFVIASAAADADDHLIYDSTTGQLSYDSDGNGGSGAIVFARLGSGLALTLQDFLVVA